jgi:predicted esterase
MAGSHRNLLDAVKEPVEREGHIAVTRTARYAWLGEAGPQVREVWIVCHGYGQLAGRFLRRFAPIADDSRVIIAPEALNRFYVDSGTGPHDAESRVGATWMTREDRLTDIDDYVRYLDAMQSHVFRMVDRAAVRLIVLGFSQGVATICRWAARTAARIDHVILWAGTVPPDLDLEPDPFRGADLTIAFGSADPWATDEIVLAMKQRFERAGRAYRLLRFEGGHEIVPHALRDVLLPTAPHS